jgi:hypothetical protein
MNFYSRIVVGAGGEVFTLGWKAVQKLAGQNLFDQPVTAGDYRINDDRTLQLRTRIEIPSPYSINIWSQPMLGVLAVYSYQEEDQAFYFWAPERISKTIDRQKELY